MLHTPPSVLSLAGHPRIAMQLNVEPRPTRQMNMKADEQLLQDVERLACQLGASRSQIARALIRNGIAALEKTAPAGALAA